jgi:REP element-mobilizing transposase RayT
VHGIVIIQEHSVGAEYIQPLQRKTKQTNLPRFQHVVPKSLGSIIRSFKAAVTREVHKVTSRARSSLWQRNYFEHIIRDDVSSFFIQQYIELNPLLWHLDQDNLDVHDLPVESLKHELTNRYGLHENALAYIVQLEEEYRAWRAYLEINPTILVEV